MKWLSFWASAVRSISIHQERGTLSQQPELPNSKPRLVVFDCDGTLVDSAQSIITCMQSACRQHGFTEPGPDDVRRMVGLPLEDAISRLYPDMAAGMVDTVREGYRDAFMALRDKGEVHEPLYHGTLDALHLLDAAGWLLGVATGKALKGLHSPLGAHGIRDRFVTLQTPDHAPGKPDPGMLYNAMTETGADASATVMVGDTTYDMEMARNAGTLAVGVAWGYHAVEELIDAGAQRVVDSYDKLPQAIEDLMLEAT